jgi:hypothetical protein
MQWAVTACGFWGKPGPTRAITQCQRVPERTRDFDLTFRRLIELRRAEPAFRSENLPRTVGR